MGILIPVIEIAYHRNLGGIGCPDSKIGTLNSIDSNRVTAQLFIQAEMLSSSQLSFSNFDFAGLMGDLQFENAVVERTTLAMITRREAERLSEQLRRALRLLEAE